MPQVQAGFWDDTVNKAKNVTQKVVGDTVDSVSEEKEEQKTTEKDKKNPDKTVEKPKPVPQSKSVSTDSHSSSAEKTPKIVIYQTGTPNGDLDIIGLRLGMSPSQAKAILTAYRDDFKIIATKSHLIGDFWIPENGKGAENRIPGSDYTKSISASNLVKLKGTYFTLYFSAPPSLNKLVYIKRVTEFQQSGPTVEAYNEAFVKKYGDEFYSVQAAAKVQAEQTEKLAKGNGMYVGTPPTNNNNDTKVIRINSGKKSTNKENYNCYKSSGRIVGNLTATSHTKTNEKCGLILVSSHRGYSIGILSRYEMILLDFDEWNKYHNAKVDFIQDYNSKIKQEKLKAASQKDPELF